MTLLARVHAYLHGGAAEGHERVEIPPFVAYFHPRDPLTFFNYAIPSRDDARDLAEPIARLRDAFRARGRVPRLEAIEDLHPRVCRALAASGFAVALRTPLMTCAPEDARPAAPVPGVSFQPLDASAPSERLAEMLRVRHEAFGGSAAAVDDAAVAETRERLAAGSRDFVATVGGRIVACATFTKPRDGLSEVAGVATLAQFRHRGIGSAITAVATRASFDAGATLAFLTPGDDGAERIYARAGYREAGTMAHYVDRG